MGTRNENSYSSREENNIFSHIRIMGLRNPVGDMCAGDQTVKRRRFCKHHATILKLRSMSVFIILMMMLMSRSTLSLNIALFFIIIGKT